MISKVINLDSYESIPKKQIENILIKPYLSILTSTSIHTDYKPTNINSAVDGAYAEYKCEKDEKS